MEGIPNVTVRRKRGLAALWRKIIIAVDGEKVAEVGNGGSVTLSLTPGRHEMKLSMMMFSSALLPFEVKDEKAQVEIQCEVGSIGIKGRVVV